MNRRMGRRKGGLEPEWESGRQGRQGGKSTGHGGRVRGTWRARVHSVGTVADRFGFRSGGGTATVVACILRARSARPAQIVHHASIAARTRGQAPHSHYTRAREPKSDSAPAAVLGGRTHSSWRVAATRSGVASLETYKRQHASSPHPIHPQPAFRASRCLPTPTDHPQLVNRAANPYAGSCQVSTSCLARQQPQRCSRVWPLASRSATLASSVATAARLGLRGYAFRQKVGAQCSRRRAPHSSVSAA